MPVNTLVVVAHPAPESLTHALAQAVIDGLGGAGNPQLRVLDLYEAYRLGFDPILSFGSLDGRQRRNMKSDPQMQEHRDALAWADHLVLVHPLWWSRAPALLEGWIDRLLSAGVGFSYPEHGRIPTPLLKGKRATVVFSADAGPLIDRLWYRRNYQTRMGRHVLGLCGVAPVRFLPVLAVRYRPRHSLDRAVERVRRHFERQRAAA